MRVFGPQDLADALGGGIDPALAAGALERRGQLRERQPSRQRGRGGELQQDAGLGAAETVLPVQVGVEGGGEYSRRRERSWLASCCRFQTASCWAREDGDGACEIAVLRQRPVGVHIGAEDVRQDEGVAGVGLLPCDRMAIAVACGGHRVDGVDLALPGPQDRDEQAAGGLGGTGIELSSVSLCSASSSSRIL